MSKNTPIDDLDSLLVPLDVCLSIDNSYLTKRISQYDPKLIFDYRPKTNSESHRKKPEKLKIIPELKNLVNILKSRLESTPEIKSITKPCNRLKSDNRVHMPPGKYYKSTQSTGGHQFSVSTRLDDSFTHKISSNSYLGININKHFNTLTTFHHKSKSQFQDISSLNATIKDKIRSHNEKVYETHKQHLIKSKELQQQKKDRLIYKYENLKWKENKDTITKSKAVWGKIVFCIGIASLLRHKTHTKKVKNT
jgi:hypothetical protein